MTKLTTLLLALAAAAALLLALAAPGGAVVGQAAKTKKIAVKDNHFSPKTLKIKKGTKLDWVWKGDNPHNVRFGKHRSKTKIHGSYAVRFTHKGTYKIYCSIHRDLGMKMKVVVK
jgi:plastocyanin